MENQNYGSLIAADKNLMPSPSSDENPTESNGLLKNGDDKSEIQLHNFGRKLTFDEVVHDQVTGPHVRKRNIGLGAVLATAIALLVYKANYDHHRYSIAISTGNPSSALNNLPSAKARRAPFSTMDPVEDLGLYDYPRPKSSTPPLPMIRGLKGTKAYPTNAWYQNLLMVSGEPDALHRAYSIPYAVDAAGPVPGVRVHPNHVDASSYVVQINIIEQQGLTVGAAADAATCDHKEKSSLSQQYKVTHATPLGVTLEWDSFPMHSSITKGMPYATMQYESIRTDTKKGESIVPTVASQVPLAEPAVIDGNKELKCDAKHAKPVLVRSEVEMHFANSDFTWLVFFSEPVWVQCVLDESGELKLQVTDWAEDPDQDRDLVIRIALYKICTAGMNPIYCHQEKMHPTALMIGQGTYGTILRTHANYFPGRDSAFNYAFDEHGETATMMFDWDVQDMSEIALHPGPANKTSADHIAFALPHQFDIIEQFPPSDTDIYCVSSLIGPTCLYEGAKWYLKEPIPNVTFRAPRPPAPWAVKSIASSLRNDLQFTLPDYFVRGAGDTYFSGKQLAKLGRVLMIAEELEEICAKQSSENADPDYNLACQNVTLPSKALFTGALDTLRSSVEIWINGTAETPFVFDSAWGGVASCGCVYNDKTSKCDNKFPECSAFEMPGLNFGNAFYNDMHFHYGYFIFSAAAVAHFDPEWGREMWEQIVVLIRCIANPSVDDDIFTTWRYKDWFQGHSWASGIAMEYSNGKNQESSSEAISAYEAIALYGKTMSVAWEETGSSDKAVVAQDIEQTGLLLAATELRSAKQYYHVERDQTIKIFPTAYTPMAIGIMWQTMAQLQTFFGSAQYLAYGIQLLPLTPISEQRDSLSWVKAMYHKFAESCSQDPSCVTNGWSVLQLAILATVGHQKMAADIAIALPSEAFDSAGGNGHSLSNTLWYISTRPEVAAPLPLTKTEKQQAANQTKSDNNESTSKGKHEVTDCGKPDMCTDYVLDTIAGLYSCRQRMDWLIQQRGHTEKEACIQVAGIEQPYECGPCDPNPSEDGASKPLPPQCALCTWKQCQSDLNRCPMNEKSFVCTGGPSTGGCSSVPWNVPSQQCQDCCELTHCPQDSPAEQRAKNEANCPPCSKAVCRGPVNQCAHQGSQYLCLQGASKGGCSALPWAVEGLEGLQCEKCCKTLPGCEE